MLLLNLFALYIPIYKLVSNLRIINSITRKADDMPDNTYGSRLIRSMVLADASILSLIIAIIILIIIPNDLGLMEHFLVLGLGLIILLIYNSRSVRKKEEEQVVVFSDEPYEVSLDDFKTMISEKMQERTASYESGTTVSIDTGGISKKE